MVRRSRVAHHAERVQIARGGRTAQVGSAAHVGNPAAEREPIEPPIARASTEDLKPVRVVKAHLDPPRSGKYWRSVIGDLSMKASEWRAGAS